MILTRSPFYYNVVFSNNFVTSVDFTLVVGNGTTTTITPLETYSFTKLKPSSDATNTWIDLSPYIRDYYSYVPITTSDSSTPEVISSTEGLLASITAQEVDSLGGDLTPTSQKYICTNGYGYYSEGQNEQPTNKILLSHNEYKAYETGYFVVPLRVASGDTNPTVNGVSVDLDFTDGIGDYIKYLVIPLGDYSNTVTVVFEGDTIYIELIEECKFGVKEVQFINRFGVLETMHFYKSAKETITTKNDNFKNAYTNGVSYDVNKHQLKQFNKKSNKKVKIETGFLNENYNITIQELMQSENVWVDNVPVNVVSSSMEFKTRIVDKLISYSIDFEYAYDEINNI